MSKGKGGIRESLHIIDLADADVVTRNGRSLPVQDRERANFGKPLVNIDEGIVGDIVFIQGKKTCFKFEGVRDPEGLASTIRAMRRSRGKTKQFLK